MACKIPIMPPAYAPVVRESPITPRENLMRALEKDGVYTVHYRVLIGAEDEAKGLGDEYVSVEHLFLSLIRPMAKDAAAEPISAMALSASMPSKTISEAGLTDSTPKTLPMLLRTSCSSESRGVLTKMRPSISFLNVRRPSFMSARAGVKLRS